MFSSFTVPRLATRAAGFAGLLLSLASAPSVAQTGYGLVPSIHGVEIPSLVTLDLSTGNILTANLISGTTSSPRLVGLDVRPATGELFVLGYDPFTSQTQLYTVAITTTPHTALATSIGPALTLNLGATTDRIGFDFDPTTDLIRVTSAARTNYRLSPVTGALVATDGILTYANTDPNAGQTLGVGAAAYTNSFAGSTSTVLYDIEDTAGRLLTQAPANNGTLNTVAPLGVNPANGQLTDLDIYYNPITHVNVAYFMSLTYVASAGTISNLYTLNLATGATTLIGPMATQSSLVTNIALAAPVTTLATRSADLAADLRLYPNPATNGTNLSFGLAQAARVEVVVTDLLGRPVDTVDAGVLPAGAQTVRWARGNQVAGLYLFSLRFDGQPAGTRRAVLSE